MKSRINILILTCLFTSVQWSVAQSNSDVAVWTTVNVAPKPFKEKWTSLFTLEYRNKEHFTSTDLYCATALVDYAAWRYFTFGFGFDFYLNHEGDNRLTPEYRYYPEAIFAYPLTGQLSFNIRSRIINTFTRWSEPDYQHRNRLKITYAVAETPVKPFVFSEFYNKFADSYKLQKYRLGGGATLKWPHHRADIYYMAERYCTRTFVRHVVELDYSFSF